MGDACHVEAIKPARRDRVCGARRFTNLNVTGAARVSPYYHVAGHGFSPEICLISCIAKWKVEVVIVIHTGVRAGIRSWDSFHPIYKDVIDWVRPKVIRSEERRVGKECRSRW